VEASWAKATRSLIAKLCAHSKIIHHENLFTRLDVRRRA
jgi:hypothetical protein